MSRSLPIAKSGKNSPNSQNSQNSQNFQNSKTNTTNNNSNEFTNKNSLKQHIQEKIDKGFPNSKRFSNNNKNITDTPVKRKTNKFYRTNEYADWNKKPKASDSGLVDVPSPTSTTSSFFLQQDKPVELSKEQVSKFFARRDTTNSAIQPIQVTVQNIVTQPQNKTPLLLTNRVDPRTAPLACNTISDETKKENIAKHEALMAKTTTEELNANKEYLPPHLLPLDEETILQEEKEILNIYDNEDDDLFSDTLRLPYGISVNNLYPQLAREEYSFRCHTCGRRFTGTEPISQVPSSSLEPFDSGDARIYHNDGALNCICLTLFHYYDPFDDDEFSVDLDTTPDEEESEEDFITKLAQMLHIEDTCLIRGIRCLIKFIQTLVDKLKSTFRTRPTEAHAQSFFSRVKESILSLLSETLLDTLKLTASNMWSKVTTFFVSSWDQFVSAVFQLAWLDDLTALFLFVFVILRHVTMAGLDELETKFKNTISFFNSLYDCFRAHTQASPINIDFSPLQEYVQYVGGHITYKNFITAMSDISKIITGVGKMQIFFSGVLVYLVRLYAIRVKGEDPVQYELLSVFPDASEFYTRYRELTTEENIRSMRFDRNLCRSIDQLSTQSKIMMTKLKGAPPDVKTCLTNINNHLVTLVKQNSGFLGQAISERPEPVCVCLKGPPQLGKSVAMEKLKKEFCRRANIPDTTLYRNSATEYWSTFNRQRVYVMDDFQQTKASSLTEDRDARDVISLVNCIPVLLAHESEAVKSLALADPDLVMLTTNMLNFDTRFINCPEALERRVHLKLIPFWDYPDFPEFTLPDHYPGVTFKKLDINKGVKQLHSDNLKFYRLTPQNTPILKNPMGETNMEKYLHSFQDIIQLMMAGRERNLKAYDQRMNFCQGALDEMFSTLVNTRYTDEEILKGQAKVYAFYWFLLYFMNHCESRKCASNPDALNILFPELLEIPFPILIISRATSTPQVFTESGSCDFTSFYFTLEKLLHIERTLAFRIFDLLIHDTRLCLSFPSVGIVQDCLPGRDFVLPTLDQSRDYCRMIASDFPLEQEHPAVDGLILEKFFAVCNSPKVVKVRESVETSDILTLFTVLATVGVVGTAAYQLYKWYATDKEPEIPPTHNEEEFLAEADGSVTYYKRDRLKPHNGTYGARYRQRMADKDDARFEREQLRACQIRMGTYQPKEYRGKRNRRHRDRNHYAQAVKDQRSETLMSTIMSKNFVKISCYSYKADKKVSNNLLGVFVFDNVLLTPKHYQSIFSKYDNVCIIPNRATVPVVDIKTSSLIHHEHPDPEVDLMLTIVPTAPKFSDIRAHFPEASELEGIETLEINLAKATTNDETGKLVMTYRGGRASIEYDVSDPYLDRVSGKTYSSMGFLTYDIATVSGDCGSLVFAVNNTLSSKLIGMHTATLGNSRNIGQLLLYDILEELFDLVPEPVAQSGFAYKEAKTPVTDACDNPTRLVFPQTIEVLTVEDKLATSTGMGKTSLRPTPFEPLLLDGSHLPAVCAAIDLPEGEDLLLMNFMKKSKYHPVFPQDLVDEAWDVFTQNVLNTSTEAEINRNLTFEEAWDGIPALDYIDAIPKDTSTGWPDNRMERAASKKHYILQNKLGEFKADCKKFSESLVDSSPVICFTLFGKDELRSAAKLEKKSVRPVFGCPAHVTVVFRQLFGAFDAWLMSNHVTNGLCVGINPYGAGWTLLASKIKVRGCAFDGDFEAFDFIESEQLLSPFVDFANRWYADSEENQIKRKNLWYAIVNHHVIYGKKIFKRCGNMPSGSPITALVNSMVVHILYLVTWGIIFKGFKEERLKTFYELCYLASYGDDNIVATDPTTALKFSPWNIKNTLKNYDINFTASDKSEITEETAYKELKDISFLQRGFRYDSETCRFLAPLSLTSIHKMISWVHSERNIEVQTRNNLALGLDELSQHGPEIYEQEAVVIRDFNKRMLGGKFAIKSYRQAKRDIIHIAAPSYFDEAYAQGPWCYWNERGYLTFNHQTAFELWLQQIFPNGVITHPPECVYNHDFNFSTKITWGAKWYIAYLLFDAGTKESSPLSLGQHVPRLPKGTDFMRYRVFVEEIMPIRYPKYCMVTDPFRKRQELCDIVTRRVCQDDLLDIETFGFNDFEPALVKLPMYEPYCGSLIEYFDFIEHECDFAFAQSGEEESTTTTQAVTTKFVDDTPSQVMQRSGATNNSHMSKAIKEGESHHSIMSFLKRPIAVANYSLALGATPGQIVGSITFPDAFYSNTMYEQKMANFRLLRCDVKIKVVQNANTFCTGRYWIFFSPYQNQVGARTYNPTLPCATGYPGVYLDLGTGTNVEFTIPFCSPLKALDLVNNLGTIGTMTIMVIDGYNSTTAAPADLTVWANMENVSLTLPTDKPSLPKPRRGAYAQSETLEKSEDKSEKHIVSDTLSGISKVSNVFSLVPFIGPYAGGVSKIFSGASAIVKQSGYCKEQNLASNTPYTNIPLKGFTHGFGLSDSVSLSTHPQNTVLQDNTIFSTTDDEMDISTIISREAIFRLFTWSVTDVQYTVLAKFPVTPGYVEFPAASTTDIDTTPLSFVASMFELWKGDMVYSLSFVKNKMYSGSLGIAYFPGVDPVNVTSVSNFDAVYREILNMRTSSTTNFIVPFTNPYGMLEVVCGTSSTTFPNPWAPSRSLGTVAIYVVNQLTAPDTCPLSITGILTHRAQNMSFSMPTFSTYHVTPYVAPGVEIEKVEAYAQSGHETVENNDTYGSVSANYFVLNKTPHREITSEPYCVGEIVHSLAEVIKRMCTAYSSASTIVSFDPTYFGTNTGPSQNVPLWYISWLYRFYRGSTRVSYYHSPTLNTDRVPATTLATSNFITYLTPPFAPGTTSYVSTVNGTAYNHLTFGSFNPTMEVQIPFFRPTPMAVISSVSTGIDNDRPVVTFVHYSFAPDTLHMNYLLGAGDDFRFGYQVGTPRIRRI